MFQILLSQESMGYVKMVRDQMTKLSKSMAQIFPLSLTPLEYIQMESRIQRY